MKFAHEGVLGFRFSQLFSRDYRLILACLVILPLMIYWQVWDFELLWDDVGDKMGHVKNPYIEELSFESFKRLFSKHFFAMYIPVSYFFWGNLNWLAGVFGVSNASVFHLANVVLHIANGVLVFVIIHQFVQHKWAVLLAALLFLLHPIQVEAVAWMSEFRGLLAGFFGLLAWYFYMLSQEFGGSKKKSNIPFLAYVFLTFALLSKPSAAAIVLFIFATNHLYYHFDIKSNFIKSAPFIIITLVFAIIAHQIQSKYGLDFAKDEISYWQRPFIWFDSIVFYLAQIIYPVNLGASYALSPKFIIAQWWFLPLAIIAPILAAGLWFLRRKMPLLILAAVIFVFGFLATSGLVSFAFQKYSLVADRYIYLAFIGICLAAADFLARVDKNYIFAIFAAILVVLGSLSAFRQIPIWADATKLWLHSRHFEVRPSYAQSSLIPVFYNKGIAAALKGELPQALKYFDDVIAYRLADVAIYPPNGAIYDKKYADLFFNRGVIMFKYKRYQEAIADFDQALEIDPKNTKAKNAKAQVLQQLKPLK